MFTNISKMLIISPHSDDELFAFPFTYPLKRNIDVLLVENDKKRYKESIKSSKLNGFNLKIYRGEKVAKGNFFHKIVKQLVKDFLSFFSNYDVILSPIIEGGHQDHDTVSFALLYCKKIKKGKAKLFFYSTYRSSEILPFIYTCGFSRNIPQDSIFKVPRNKKILLKIFKTILLSYKSQYKTWLLLFPALIFADLRGDLNKLCDAEKLDFKKVILLIPDIPLYQNYRNLKRGQWLKEIKDYI
mgnify:CR=1 FL=1|tara:strand:+ start:2022 stop:2747 length:726 start_codon:yes stop_codon:yes gene_type:complete